MKLRRACKIVVTTETIDVIYEMNERQKEQSARKRQEKRESIKLIKLMQQKTATCARSLKKRNRN